MKNINNKKNIFFNDKLKLFNTFLILNNIDKKEIILIHGSNLDEKVSPFNDKSYSFILCNKNEIFLQWSHYFLTHTTEYKIFLRFLKENNIYENFKAYCNLNKPLIRSYKFIYDTIREEIDCCQKNKDDWENLMFYIIFNNGML